MCEQEGRSRRKEDLSRGSTVEQPSSREGPRDSQRGNGALAS